MLGNKMAVGIGGAGITLLCGGVLRDMQEPEAQEIAMDVAKEVTHQVHDHCGFALEEPLVEKDALLEGSTSITATARMTAAAYTDEQKDCVHEVLVSPKLQAIDAYGCDFSVAEFGYSPVPNNWVMLGSGDRLNVEVDCLSRSERGL